MWPLVALCAVAAAVGCWPMASTAAALTATGRVRLPPRWWRRTCWPVAIAITSAGVCGAVSYWRLGPTMALPPAGGLAAAAPALALCDLRLRRLPDLLIAPIVIVWAITACTACALGTPAAATALTRGVIAAAAVAAAGVAIAVLRPGLGGGDIKLSAALAAVTAWSGVSRLVGFGVLSAALLLFQALVAVAHRRGLRAAIPAGPALCLAALAASVA